MLYNHSLSNLALIIGSRYGWAKYTASRPDLFQIITISSRIVSVQTDMELKELKKFYKETRKTNLKNRSKQKLTSGINTPDQGIV